MNTAKPNCNEEFATDVVRRLQEAGHEALWAGGCVRDRIQGKSPKDYDVATSATPQEVRNLFGNRRTLAIGESFGVIVVLGPHATSPIEVATFRVDMGYSDGRRPDAVEFSSAEEDAKRRDFTINGMFYDPIAIQAIDYVGGQADLRDRIVRAIGDPQQRFGEDKLRMLRAVRFTANLDFNLDPATLAAITEHAQDIQVVSAERIGGELRRMLTHRNRARAFELLRQSRLLEQLLPELADIEEAAFGETRQMLATLPAGELGLPLAIILRQARSVASSGLRSFVENIRHRWKLTNRDVKLTLFLLEHESLVRQARQQPWPQLQRVLIHPDAKELVQYAGTVAQVADSDTSDIEFCRAKLQLPADELNPPALLTGNDLQQMGIDTGKIYREILDSLRDEQLCGRVTDRQTAIRWVERFLERE